nr:MAG TPA: hypothetical protein [Caudoviricetes sp.]
MLTREGLEPLVKSSPYIATSYAVEPVERFI